MRAPGKAAAGESLSALRSVTGRYAGARGMRASPHSCFKARVFPAHSHFLSGGSSGSWIKANF